MTLQEFQQTYEIPSVNDYGGRGKAFPCFSRIQDDPNASWDLFHLSDYVVSSVHGGSYYLWPRELTNQPEPTKYISEK